MSTPIDNGLRLRVKHVDFGSGEITIREGKGDKDRRTMLPEKLRASLQEHLERVKKTHARDLVDDYRRVPLAYALDRKYQTRQQNGPGSSLFRKQNAGSIQKRESRAVITLTNRLFRKQSRQL